MWWEDSTRYYDKNGNVFGGGGGKFGTDVAPSAKTTTSKALIGPVSGPIKTASTERSAALAALAATSAFAAKASASSLNVTNYNQTNLTQPGLNLNELFRKNQSLLAKEGFSLDMLNGMNDYDVQSLLKSLGISVP